MNFVKNSLLLGNIRENNTFGAAVRAAYTGDLDGLAFIMRCAGAEKVTLVRVHEFAAKLVEDMNRVVDFVDAQAPAYTRAQVEALMERTIESLQAAHMAQVNTLDGRIGQLQDALEGQRRREARAVNLFECIEEMVLNGAKFSAERDANFDFHVQVDDFSVTSPEWAAAVQGVVDMSIDEDLADEFDQA